MSHYHRNLATFNRAQARFDAALPPEEDGWERCDECHGTGELAQESCEHCSGCGGFDTAIGAAITAYEYERQQQRAREDALAP